jgi:hypothetical protein
LPYRHLSAAAAFGDIGQFTDAAASTPQGWAKNSPVAGHCDAQNGSLDAPFIGRLKGRTSKGK